MTAQQSLGQQLAQEKAVEFIPFGSMDPIKLTAAMVRSFIATPTKSGKLPDDRQCMRFVALCKARRLNPFEGDAFLIGYDGHAGPEFSLITAHQAFLKRAESSSEYDGMESGVIVEADYYPDAAYGRVRVLRNMGKKITYARDGDFIFSDERLVGGWAQVNFKTRKIPTLRQVNLSTFDKGFGQWKGDSKAGMIVKCAEADALRSSFPTLLGGMYAEGEVNPVESSSAMLPLDSLNGKLLGHDPEKAESKGNLRRVLDVGMETRTKTTKETIEQPMLPSGDDSLSQEESSVSQQSLEPQNERIPLPVGDAFKTATQVWTQDKKNEFRAHLKRLQETGVKNLEATAMVWDHMVNGDPLEIAAD